ncbi:hypothetical protein JCM5353_004471 [Sporobolomyces roseus]
MVPVVGNWFNAQQVFNANDFACSAGQSIGEYCSAAQDTCCAVCPNAPVTGPGTLIVMSLGTLMNLIFVLWYQSEAPYNLAYQLVATDGAAFGLMNRLIQDDFRLSQFHYYFIPLAIMSCMPLALAACLCDVPSLHSMNPSAQELLKRATWKERKDEARHRRENNHNESAQPLLPSTSNSLPTRGFRRRRMGSDPLNENQDHSPVAAVRSKRVWTATNPSHSLLQTAWCFFTVHLIAWPFLFGYVYFINDTFNQAICNETFDFRFYRLLLIGFVGSWLFFALIVWVLFTRVLFFGARKRDMIETVGAALLFVSRPKSDRGLPPNHWIDPFPTQKHGVPFLKSGHARGRSILRCALSIGCYWLWLAQYMGIYFVAVRDFMLIGMNGFDFGQIVAVIGIIIPIALIARASFDYDDAWETKRALWAKEAKNNQAGPVEDSVNPQHTTLAPNWKPGDPIPTPLTESHFVTVNYHSDPEDPTKVPKPSLEFPKEFKEKMSKKDDGSWSSGVEEALFNPPKNKNEASNRGGSQRGRSQRRGSQRGRHPSVHRVD